QSRGTSPQKGLVPRDLFYRERVRLFGLQYCQQCLFESFQIHFVFRATRCRIGCLSRENCAAALVPPHAICVIISLAPLTIRSGSHSGGNCPMLSWQAFNLVSLATRTTRPFLARSPRNTNAVSLCSAADAHSTTTSHRLRISRTLPSTLPASKPNISP
ncbi:hypothetical protein C8R43DRAFT_1207406, partial [Mycena crocata]